MVAYTILALDRLRQEDCKLKAMSGLHTASSRLDYATCKMFSKKGRSGNRRGQGAKGKERKMKKRKGKQKKKGSRPTHLREAGCAGEEEGRLSYMYPPVYCRASH